MTRYKHKISLEKFNAYRDNQANSIEFTAKTSAPGSGLLWMDQNVLFGNTGFQVRKRCELPKKFKEILKQTAGDSRILSDNHNYCALITSSVICLHVYKSDQPTIQVPLTDQHGTLPFVNIFYASDNIGISVINSKTNKAFYWNNVLKSTTLNYPVTLRSQAGTITTTCTLNQQKMLLVGTSLGDIFPLTCKNDGMELVSRTEDSVVSYISSFFVQKPWLDSPAAQNKERIVSIVNVLDAVYVLSEKHIQVLHLNNDLQLELTGYVSILEDLTKSISEHIPNNVSIENIRIEALDIDSKLKNELVLLSSYQLPVMGDYIQYAASTISIKHTPDDTILFRIKHTASAPFSANTQSSSIPKLSISKSIAFITFDSHVIAVSRNKKSAFEEPVVLVDGDRILCTQVDNDGQEDSNESAVIFTLMNGVLDFDIDIRKIQGPEIDGNMYAGYVSNTVDLDTIIIQSKLEQAVLFGASAKTPIQFPLSIEKEDISSVVNNLLNELMENTQFLPLTLDVELRAEARYVFVNRIFEVLLDNKISSCVNSVLRLKLMNCAEICYIALCLLQEYNGIVDDEPLKKVWVEAVKNTSSMKNESNVKEFFSTQVDKSYQFLDEAICVCFTDVVKEQDRGDVVYKMLDIIMRVLGSGRYFKESYGPLYKIEENKDKEHLFGKLVTTFEKTANYIINSKGHDNPKLVEKLSQVAEILMDYSITDEQLEDDVPALVMKYVLLLGKPEFAMKLAEKIKDLRAIVTLANSSKSSKGDVVAVNAAWIDKFGAPYFLQLFKWLEKQNKDEEILKFDSKYPDQVAKCFAQANLSISWKYFLKHGLYNECLNAIHIALMNEKRIKNRHEMLTWCKLITIKNHGNKDRPLDAFEKPNVIFASALLEHENIQLQLLNEFNKYLSRTESANKVTAITNQYYRKSESLNKLDLECFSNAIKILLEGVSLNEHQLIFVLLHISNYKTTVENVITALKLASRIKYQQRHLSAQLQNTIWKQVYYHDLNTYKDAHSANYSDISRRSILQGTLVFRILHSVHKNKIEIDEMIAPSNIKLNKDELEAKTIESDGFNTFISQISLLATDNSSITLQEMKMTIQL